MADEDLWRRRFHLFVLVRLIGMATFALGVVIWLVDAGLIWLGVKQFSRSALMARYGRP